jgi:DNA-binding transcriptional regulator YhcF (GntR family)
MKIRLTKKSEIPLHQQLAEQIVFLISTGELRPSEQLPSVRSLARRLNIHRNTVSKAYGELVLRDWLKRKRGSRLFVAPAVYLRGRGSRDQLDELIDQSTERAREMGYSIATVRARVAERLALQPPNHVLVVEHELGLRKIIEKELRDVLTTPVVGCSPAEFSAGKNMAPDAQVVAPEYAFPLLAPVASNDWPPIRLIFSTADEHLKLIRNLKQASVVAVVSVSKTFLKTAHSLLAESLEKRHVFRKVLMRPKEHPDLTGVDLVFCDSVAIDTVRSRRKVHYRMLAERCLTEIAALAKLSETRRPPG